MTTQRAAVQGRPRPPWPPACPPSPPSGPSSHLGDSAPEAVTSGQAAASAWVSSAGGSRRGEELPGPSRLATALAGMSLTAGQTGAAQAGPAAAPALSHSHAHAHTHAHSFQHSGPSATHGLPHTPVAVATGAGGHAPLTPHSPLSATAQPVNIPSQALSPPTPAPSPTPTERWSYAPLQVTRPEKGEGHEDEQSAKDVMDMFRGLPKGERYAFLSSLIGELELTEALVLSSKISPRLKRDFLSDLPVELALHCVSFIDDPRTLGRALRVSKYWNALLQDERLWKDMFDRQLFRAPLSLPHMPHPPPAAALGASNRPGGQVPPPGWQRNYAPPARWPVTQTPSYRERFRNSYLTESNWLHGGRLLTRHSSMGDSVVTSLAVNEDYIVIGMANSKLHVFDAATGYYRQSLIGHELGVWALVLVSPRQRGRAVPRDSSRRASFTGGTPSRRSGTANVPVFRSTSSTGSERSPSHQRANKRVPSSDVCGAAASWGIKRTLVVSGGCDRVVRVWDIITGECVWSLQGHSSTVRCLKVLDGRPIAVSGSRDFTLRVWDIDRGRMLRVLEGHEQSVRCIEVAGNQVVSGSYDYTCRLWDIDTGECLQVFEGHYLQIYAVAFDGERVVSGSLDSTVRVWDAASGECLAILQGHTSLVGQLQLSGDRLITGGSDGRVIVFDLNDYSCVHRICAHDNSVTCLQFDDRFIVSGGNDGYVKLWDIQTGKHIRDLTRPSDARDAVWRVCFRDDRCAILCQRNERTVLEVLGFRPQDEQIRPLFTRTPDW